MAGRKDAAWWRDYRRRKQEQAQGAHATPVATPEKTPVVDTVDTSYVSPEERAAFKQSEYRRVMPAFLVAPDDDCKACGHDRQSYHLEGVCRFPVAPRRRCGCPSFVDAAEPF